MNEEGRGNASESHLLLFQSRQNGQGDARSSQRLHHMHMSRFKFEFPRRWLTSRTTSRSECAVDRKAESLKLATVVCSSASRSGAVT